MGLAAQKSQELRKIDEKLSSLEDSEGGRGNLVTEFSSGRRGRS